MEKREIIAVCGLDCGPCDIRRAPDDPEAAQRIVAWFKKEGWPEKEKGIAEVIERGMYCKGCRGDRTVHWSPDCWILECCVDEKGYTFCYECSEFPCERLLERARENEQYGQALNRLKQMKETRENETQ